MATIIALEGSVCGGKTTTALRLYREEGIHVAREYMDMLNEDDKNQFEKLTPGSKLELLLSLDAKRNALLRETDAKQIVLDRSALCLFAFEYAMKRIGGYCCTDLARQAIKKHSFVLPNQIIYFDANSSAREMRLGRRRGKISSVFLDDAFNSWYKMFFTGVSNWISTTFIDTNNMSLEEVYAAVQMFVNQPVRLSKVVDAHELLSPFFAGD